MTVVQWSKNKLLTIHLNAKVKTLESSNKSFKASKTKKQTAFFQADWLTDCFNSKTPE